MNEIVNVTNYYSENDNTFSTFSCPNCETEWGPSSSCDPPANIVEKVKCTCGVILEVSGEWESRYYIDCEISDE